jgi:hypothetical protein
MTSKRSANKPALHCHARKLTTIFYAQLSINDLFVVVLPVLEGLIQFGVQFGVRVVPPHLGVVGFILATLVASIPLLLFAVALGLLIRVTWKTLELHRSTTSFL